MKKSSKNRQKPKFLLILSIIIGIILAVSLFCNFVFLIFSLFCNNLSTIEQNKLAVFDDLAFSYINEIDLNEDNPNDFYQMTGYGISNEDNVFYITFKIFDYTNCANETDEPDIQYGVVYFWPSNSQSPYSNTISYSHAYSYHSEPYHPEGEYVSLPFALE